MDNIIKISIVDDESLFLEGLSLLLENNKDLSVVLTATSGTEFLSKLSETSPNSFPEIALVDIQMKPMDGFELVQLLKTDYPDLKIIILSSHYKHAMFGHMIKLGVSAFLPKNAGLALLSEAIEKVQKTGVFFTKNDYEMMSSFIKNKSQTRYLNTEEDLSDREKEVLQLICAELTNQEIADKLNLSKRTVESHRQRILDKIGAKNTAGLVVFAISNEIYTPNNKFF